MTERKAQSLPFQDLASRKVVVDFDGGNITSDGGAVLLREVEAKLGFAQDLARCFTDHRDAGRVEHSLVELLKQRLFGLCLGYEDLNDHDQLRKDPHWSVLVGKEEPGTSPIAGKSTLNRLELTPRHADADDRYKKISADLAKMQDLFVEAFVRQAVLAPKRLVLDVDSTDFPLHGHQLGRFFHGYYDSHCYLPLYVFCGDFPLLALLRPSNIDDSLGARKHLARIVAALRRHWPQVEIAIRGDGAFCREHLMRWCEENRVDFVFGMAKNQRLVKIVGGELHQAKLQFEQTEEAARVFKDFTYRTKKSWSRERRVVGKAEHLKKGSNPRFVVTSLSAETVDAQTLYEKEYCGRGDMENRIKETKLFLFAQRTSCATMRANQLRLCLSTAAYILMRTLRTVGLKETPLEHAQCDTIRLRLLKIGAIVKVSVRRVLLRMSEGFPMQEVFRQAWARLQSWIPQRCGVAFASEWEESSSPDLSPNPSPQFP